MYPTTTTMEDLINFQDEVYTTTIDWTEAEIDDKKDDLERDWDTTSTKKTHVVKAYDDKNNLYDNDNFKRADDHGSGSSTFMRTTAPSTILVIGIIIVAIVALILIVIIVLRTRTRYEAYKVDDSRTYHFGNQGNDEFEPLPSTLENPTLAATVVRANMGSNGDFTNGNKATILPKKTTSSKPVREWYV